VTGQGPGKRLVLRLVALVGCTGFVLASGPPAEAAPFGGLAWAYNRAAVVNHMDDSLRTRSAFDVRVTSAAAVVASNQALANSRCDDCRTVAVAFQVVAAGGGPTDVYVTNHSAAINEGCSGCDALALAYQFVVLSEDKLRLSTDGRLQLRQAEDDVRALLEAAPADSVIMAEAGAIAQRVERVLAEELDSSPEVRRDVDRHTPPDRPADEGPAPTPPPADLTAAGPWPLSGLPVMARP
jgi:hypothetical protein